MVTETFVHMGSRVFRIATQRLIGGECSFTTTTAAAAAASLHPISHLANTNPHSPSISESYHRIHQDSEPGAGREACPARNIVCLFARIGEPPTRYRSPQLVYHRPQRWLPGC